MNPNEPSPNTAEVVEPQVLEPGNEVPSLSNEHIPNMEPDPIAHSVEFVRLGRGGIEVSIGTFTGTEGVAEEAVFMRLARTDPAIEGRLLAGFLFLGPDHARKVFDAVVGVETAGDKMVKATKEYMLKHNISCAESVYQNDNAVIDASQLVEKMCEAVGYPKSEEEVED